MRKTGFKSFVAALAGASAFACMSCGGGGGGSGAANWVLFTNQGLLLEYNRNNGDLNPIRNLALGSVSRISVDTNRTKMAVVHLISVGNYEVLVMDRDGSDEDVLTGYKAASVSPDGTQIALVDTNNQIFVADIDGSNADNIFNGNFGAGIFDVSWSPDGSQILFTYAPTGWERQALINSDGSTGGTPTYLTIDGQSNADGRFSPDGQSIVFTSARDGNSEIYIMDADGTDQTRLTVNTGEDAQASFNATGTKVYFRSFRDSQTDIYEMDPDGVGVALVLDEATDESWPTAG